MAEETLKDKIKIGCIALVQAIIAGPFILLYLFIRWLIDIYRIGWRLAWIRVFKDNEYEKYQRIKKARLRRIDKEQNGWPTDPVERAKCPRLDLRNDNYFEGNDYIRDSTHTLIYVANEKCPELEEIMRTRLDELNQWAETMRFNVVYLPAVLESLKEPDIQRYKMPWADNIENDNLLVGNDYMFRFLVHPEDRLQMKHGFLLCRGEVRSDHYVSTFIYHYYELLPPSESDWDEHLKALREIIGKDLHLFEPYLNCTLKDSAGDEPDDFADNGFNSQVWMEDIDDLMAEIREKVEALRQRGVAQHLLEQLIHPSEKLSKLVITSDFRIFLPDYQNLEIKMEPLAKAVYLLFLRYPEGLRFKELPEYRGELTEIYLKMKPNGLTERAKKSLEDVTNPLKNSINEKCARIREAFVGQFDDFLACHYYIDGLRAKPKKIALPRELVQWEE